MRRAWIQALTEASDDAEIRRFLRKQMREVHDFVSDVIRRSQEAGGIYPTVMRMPKRGSSSRSASWAQ